ncbi:MAG: TetR/AcrR family transcriptional regulator [Proteobacteria bacterium]|nr:TetR/AcrR family transcriptional regulator [Pseudomonadota bacterium]
MVATMKKAVNKPKMVLEREIKAVRLKENKMGRKRDPGLDTAILKASLEVLAELGYEGMTMDGVAERAKVGKASLYRRWPSKESLVLDAVTQMKQSQVDLDHLPNTGTLRGDLLALVRPQSNAESEFKLKVMSGLSAMIAQHQTLAGAGTAAIVEPWSNVYRKLIRRSVERGEAKVSVEIEMIAQIVPSMMAFRSIVLRKPFDKRFLISLVDEVVLPALGITKK